ncbi:MAG TPA: ABC transporter substrate-binding protein [Stellaceae bacterium]|nr:ABC transporter substrate-binding protein [Stellaceae bacterium]
MKAKLGRREFLIGSAAASVLPRVSFAQGAPLRVGMLMIGTGPLAEGGKQMQQGLTLYLKERNYTLAGRKIELTVADTGGNPAGAKNKAQELVERDKVDIICGPFAAFEMLAITDYVQDHKIPTLALAGADDVTQRRPNPYFLRSSATSSQAMHPLGDYARKEMKLSRVAALSEDFAFGYENIGGFQQVFEDEGGRVVKKLWPPLVTGDYTPFLAQISDVDGVATGITGSNPIKFVKQYKDAGIKVPLIGGEGTADDSLLPRFGDEAIGLITACPYSSDLPYESNRRFVAAFEKEYDTVAGFTALTFYINGQIIEAALKETGGKTDDKEEFIKVMRALKFTETPRGPMHFDHFGNVVGNVYIRRIEKKGGKLVNTTIKTYENVSQFWTYDEKKYLAQPVYTRDYPPLKS